MNIILHCNSQAWPCFSRSRSRSRDLDIQGHVRLIVTVWNYIYTTSATPKTCKTKKDHHSSVTRTRDKEGHAQGHVTWIYEVTLDGYSAELYLFDIGDPKNLRNKQKIIAPASLESDRDKKGHAQGHVTLIYKVTLDGYSAELYLFDISDPKNLWNKQKIIALASLESEIRKVTFRVTWPWRTGSRLKATVWIYVHLSSLSKITYKIAQNIISVAYPGLEIGTVMWKLLWKSAWPWISRSRFNDNTLNLLFLKASAFLT